MKESKQYHKMKKKDQGLMMQLQHFSVHDGDGIRTTIFMAGCPLRCQWCANPESWGRDELLDPLSGKPLRHWQTLDEVVSEVRRYMIFYRYSGGGITYSGGEPTCQPGFLKQMVEGFYAMGIDQTIETCGYFQWDLLESTLEKLDAFFIDIKTMDDKLHMKLTGRSNQVILENIKRIALLKKPIVIRVPLIPGVNDGETNIEKTAAFIKRFVPDSGIEVLPYHKLGLEKYALLGIDSGQDHYQVPTPETMNRVKEMFHQWGVKVVSYQ